MEKQATPEAESLLRKQNKPRRVNGFRKSLIASALVAVLVFHFHDTLFPWRHHKATPQVGDVKPFNWQDLSRKPHLEYEPCYGDEFQCAQLELPMDYWNDTTNATIGLAVIKKPAVVPVTHPQYGGAILFNPGGPGGSGVFFLLGFADHIRDVLEGHNGEDKYFDLISFDPRGVGLSKPGVQCAGDLVLGESLALRMLEEGVFSSSDAAFSRIWSLTNVWSQLCSQPVSDPDVKKYVTTASVARDMLELVEHHGQWREKEAKRLLKENENCRALDSSGTANADAEVLESLKYKPDKEKINYLGFSYGSFLGNTFAAMYPDRINRLAVDGVVDAYDYKKSLWFDNLVDTEKDMDTFYYHCARVGYPKCALGNETGTTTQEGVKEKALGIIESLYHNPLAVIAPVPEVVLYSDVKALILMALYSPMEMFPFMADLMAELERGDGSTIASFQLHEFICSNCCADYGKCDEMQEGGDLFVDATMAIACGDGDDQTGVTKAEFKKHMEKISKLSPTVGEIWANHRLRCIHYSVRPYHRFEGPWVGNTSHPILEIGNTADPVTPGRFAKKMAKGFPGAVALIQDSAGHCSLATPSKCTESYVRRYFQAGELPEPDTVCEADEMPFGPAPGDDEVQTEEAVKRRMRAANFAKALYASGGGFMRGHDFQRMLRLL